MDVQHILSTYYQIQAKTIDQITDRVYRIWDGRNTYAFKKSSLNHENIPMWHHALMQANKHNLQFIQPVYLTLDQQLTVYDNEHVYYLSPWLEQEGEMEIGKIYQHLGQLHHKTKRTHTIQVKKMTDKFIEYKKVCQDRRRMFMTQIEEFEQKRYMSPFELQVCTQFHVVEGCLHHLIDLIERFCKIEDETMPWSQSLCHGNLTFSHLLTANDYRFINWEKTTYDHATTDLMHLFQSEINYYDAPVQDLLDNFSIYLKENKLTQEEICFLLIYLMNPLPYLEQIKDYQQDIHHKPMIHRVQRMAYLYRQLEFSFNMYDLLEPELNND